MGDDSTAADESGASTDGGDRDVPASEDPNADRQYHVGVEPGDVADSVLLPGNPERVEKVTEGWDDHALVAEHREYRTATGTHDGTPISVTSTGVGSPSAAIAVEELAAAGVETFLRVGTTGALQSGIEVGDMVVATGAAKDEGTTRRYEADTVPAVPTFEVVRALVDAKPESEQ